MEKEVHKFKSSLETVIRNEEYLEPGLAYFPSGSCEIASLIYGCFLLKKFPKIELVYGKRVHITNQGQSTTHVWLELDGLKIDLTAGQFPDSESDVIISYQSQFLATFDIEDRVTPSFDRLRSLSADNHEYYRSIYDKVCIEFSR